MSLTHFAIFMADTGARIREQCEYYFSDSNLVVDKFLVQQILADPEGFVPLTTLLRFNRLKNLVGTDAVLLATNLEGSDKLELNAGKTSVRRRAPFEDKAAVNERVFRNSIYAKVSRRPGRAAPPEHGLISGFCLDFPLGRARSTSPSTR